MRAAMPDGGRPPGDEPLPEQVSRPGPATTATLVTSTRAVVLGVAGGIAAYKACELLRLLHRVGPSGPGRAHRGRAAFRRRADLGRAVGPAGRNRRLAPTSTTCRTSRSANRPTWSWSLRPPPTCWPRPPTASPTTCSPPPCSPPAVRSCSRRRCTPRCGSIRPPWTTSPRCGRRGVIVIEPALGRLTGADTGKGRLPDPAEIFAVAQPGAAPRRRPSASPPVCWSGGTSWSPPAAPRAARPGALPRQPVLGQAGVRLRPHRGRAGRQVTLIAANVSAAGSGRRDRGPGRHHRGAAQGHRGGGRRGRCGGDGRGAGRLPPGRVRRRRRSKKSTRSARRRRSRWSPIRTSPPSSASASAPVRCWSRSPPRPTNAIARTPARSSSASEPT